MNLSLEEQSVSISDKSLVSRAHLLLVLPVAVVLDSNSCSHDISDSSIQRRRLCSPYGFEATGECEQVVAETKTRTVICTMSR